MAKTYRKVSNHERIKRLESVVNDLLSLSYGGDFQNHALEILKNGDPRYKERSLVFPPDEDNSGRG